ncbi:ubiquitin-conjugating enzyme/RWD-like protein [Scheffersomyces amazonensis]|uniref:ubiquitin-conjugating enzyme/RWD-like protein n=1 Tax=Scheffersomyces amazonensis TaxID=1078765 RepID=UPI00315CD255
MLKLREQQRKRQEALEASKANSPSSTNSQPSTKASGAQVLLQKNLTELELPNSTKIEFPNPTDFFNFNLFISPVAGYYKGGKFTFTVAFTQNFPFEPPKVKCINKIYHPNIDLEGNVCLNILREDWKPFVSVTSIVMGLNHLFLEPNPNDPLNKDAANTFVKDINQFRRDVSYTLKGGVLNGDRYDNVISRY